VDPGRLWVALGGGIENWSRHLPMNWPNRLLADQLLYEHMELFCKLLWLLVVLGSVCTCYVDRIYRRRAAQHVREWITLACASVIVFFPVSVSDDPQSSIVSYNVLRLCLLMAIWNCGYGLGRCTG
jgi:hypothetical protein